MGYPVLLVIAVIVLGLDQITKHLALTTLDPYAPLAVTAFFNLVLVWNPGVSFGMLGGLGADNPLVLGGLTLLIVTVLLFWGAREPRALPRAALAMIVAGAIGNLIDRLRFGAVVDFLDFHLAGYHWPAFNVSDSAIVVGAMILLWDGFRRHDDGKSREAGGEA